MTMALRSDGAESTLRALEERTRGRVSAACLVDGKPVVVFGQTDLIYPLYSLTKPLIAFMVVQQANGSSLALTEPIGALTELDLPRWAQSLTLEHLLNHTSGLRDYGGLEGYHAQVKRQPPRPWSPQEFLDRVAVDGPAFAQGEGFLYSNPGYMLLVSWLKQQSGKDLTLLFRDAIADRLQLRSAFVAVTPDDLARCAPGYSTYFSAELQDIRPLYHPRWVSHGLIAATAYEAALMLDAVVPALLDRDMGAIRLLPFEVPDCSEPFYYHGLMGDRGRRMFGHNGGGPGYSISAFRRDTTVSSVICDRDDADAASAVREILSPDGND
jgi:D-alanyl-D-alanine carboxypeptidase